MEAINPFSTRFLRPDANQYLFEEFSNSPEQIVELSRARCEELVDMLLGIRSNEAATSNGMRWSIVGPHGTGKSTLTCCLIELILKRYVPVQVIRLSTEQRQIKQSWKLQTLAKQGIFIVDGYEQLSIVGKLQLCIQARSLEQCLLITAHTKMLGFRTLYETKRTRLTEEIVVRNLLEGLSVSSNDLLTSTFWQDSKQRHGQNLRESLFDAYDWYEQQTR